MNGMIMSHTSLCQHDAARAKKPKYSYCVPPQKKYSQCVWQNFSQNKDVVDTPKNNQNIVIRLFKQKCRKHNPILFAAADFLLKGSGDVITFYSS